MEKIQKCVEKGESVKGQSLIEQWMLEKRMSEDEMIISAVGMFGAGVDTVNKCYWTPGFYANMSQLAQNSISGYASLVPRLPQTKAWCLSKRILNKVID